MQNLDRAQNPGLTFARINEANHWYIENSNVVHKISARVYSE